MLIAIVGGLTAGNDCATIQPERARYLVLQIVCLVLWLPISFSPWLFMKMKGDVWIHE